MSMENDQIPEGNDFDNSFRNKLQKIEKKLEEILISTGTNPDRFKREDEEESLSPYGDISFSKKINEKQKITENDEIEDPFEGMSSNETYAELRRMNRSLGELATEVIEVFDKENLMVGELDEEVKDNLKEFIEDSIGQLKFSQGEINHLHKAIDLSQKSSPADFDGAKRPRRVAELKEMINEVGHDLHRVLEGFGKMNIEAELTSIKSAGNEGNLVSKGGAFSRN